MNDKRIFGIDTVVFLIIIAGVISCLTLATNVFSKTKTLAAQDHNNRDSLISSITTKYDVKTQAGPWKSIGIAFLRKIGKIPEEITYEDIVRGDSLLKQFSMRVRGGKNQLWLDAYSDTAKYSFLEPPLKSKVQLLPQAILFVEELRNFLSNPNSQYLSRTFPFNGDMLSATVHRREAPEEFGEVVKRYKAYAPRFFRIYTVDNQGRAYIEGIIIADTFQDQTIYPFISIELKDEGVTIKLLMKSVEVYPKK